MSSFQIRDAEKRKAKSRVMLEGPAGSGKTYSALLMAKGLGCTNVVVVDTECSSADLYANLYKYKVMPFAAPYNPERYVEAIAYAVSAGHDAVILDGISPEWKGEGGCLEIHSKLGGKFQDWARVTPRHNAFIQAILNCPIHIFVTVRTKVGYEINDRKVSKLGLAPEMREGMDYEMTCVFSLNQQHMATASKDRTSVFDGQEQVISETTGAKLLAWLNDGSDAPAPVPTVLELKHAFKDSSEVGHSKEVMYGTCTDVCDREISNALDVPGNKRQDCIDALKSLTPAESAEG